MFFYIIRQRLIEKRTEDGPPYQIGSPKDDFGGRMPVISTVMTEADVDRYFPYPDSTSAPDTPTNQRPLSFRFLGQFIGQAWRRLDIASKAVLQRRAQRFSEDYRVAMDEWNKTEQAREAMETAILRELTQVLPDPTNDETEVFHPMPPVRRGKVLELLPRPPPTTIKQEPNSPSSTALPHVRRPPTRPEGAPSLPARNIVSGRDNLRPRRAHPDDNEDTAASVVRRQKMRYVTPEPAEYHSAPPHYPSSSPRRHLSAAEQHQLLIDPMPLMTWHPPPPRVPPPPDLARLLNHLTGEVQRLSQQVSRLTTPESAASPHSRRTDAREPPVFTAPWSPEGRSGFAQYVRPDPPRHVTWAPPSDPYGPPARWSGLASEWWNVGEWRAIQAARENGSWEEEAIRHEDGKPPAE
jgi:hypothetical protein